MNLATELGGVIWWVAFFAILVTAVVSDVRHRRVSNRLTGLLLVTGVTCFAIRSGPWAGIVSALGGAGTALLIWFPMYAFRLMGAGDVKLIAAGSAWIGWQGALIASFATGLIGGALGLLWLLHRQGWASAFTALFQSVKAPQLLQLRPLDRRERVPYAIAIALGLTCGWWWMVLPDLR